MSEQVNADGSYSQSHIQRMWGSMPGWKRKMLGLSLVVGVLGAGGQVASKVLKKPPAATATSTAVPAPSGSNPAMPSGSSGYVTGQPNTATPADAPVATDTTTATPTTTETVTPWMTRVGLSFFVGIVVGVISRTFLKVAAFFAVIVGGAIAAMSYFHVLNIDMTSVKTEYTSVSGWIGDQATRFKDLVMHTLPSSTSAAAGFLSGFKRR